jgi:VanZ family protein
MSDGPTEEIQASGERLAWFLLVAYLLPVVYASLSPFSGWRAPPGDPAAFLAAPWPRYWTWFDLAINVVAYVPAGMLLALALMSHMRRDLALLCATLLGGLISFGLELGQAFLPGRISSNLDFAMNMTGAFVGALLAVRAGNLDFVWERFAAFRSLFRPGAHADLGLALLALWFFSQLDPSLPLLGNIGMPDSIEAALNASPRPARFSFLAMGAAMLTLFAVGLMLTLIVRSPIQAVIAAAAMVVTAAITKLVAGLALLKPAVRFEWISLEVWIGAGYALALIALCAIMPAPRRRILCALSLLAVVLMTQIFSAAPGDTAFLKLFSWHYGQLLNFTGLARAVGQAWPFLALGWLYLWRPSNRSS